MVEIPEDELKSLKRQLMKLKLESKLRSNMSRELDRQKSIAEKAELLAKEKSEEIEAIANQLSKYLSPQLYDSIFSGKKEVVITSEKKYLTIFFSDLVSFTNISDTMDIKGTLVPAYTINSILGQIPLIGRLLVGKENGGLFALTFGMQGKVESPSISINPLLSLSPGFIREFFSVFKTDSNPLSPEELQVIGTPD